MEFTKEFIEANGLAENQIQAITKEIETSIIPTLKKEFEGVANKNAEGILSGASKSASQKFGVEIEREQGEKWAEYLERISDSALSNKTQKLIEKEKELEDKLKNFKGSDELKEKYEKQLKDNDDLLKKVAELEPLKGMDALLKEKDQELTGLKRTVAFNSVKPSFPDTVNKYEADAKWGEFVKGFDEKFNLELIDGQAYGVDKENHHKKVKLSDIISADTNINELLKGRQQKGTGANPMGMKNVDGLPFEIPMNASSEDLTKVVREHLLAKLGSITHKDYSKEFSDLYKKAKSA
jgi:hypothetical protein